MKQAAQELIDALNRADEERIELVAKMLQPKPTLEQAARFALEVLEESCYPRASIKHYKLYDDAIEMLTRTLENT